MVRCLAGPPLPSAGLLEWHTQKPAAGPSRRRKHSHKHEAEKSRFWSCHGRADSSRRRAVGGDRLCARLYEEQNEEEASVGTAGPSFLFLLLLLLLVHNSTGRESRCFPPSPRGPITPEERGRGVGPSPWGAVPRPSFRLPVVSTRDGSPPTLQEPTPEGVSRPCGLAALWSRSLLISWPCGLGAL